MRIGMILDKTFPPDPRVENEALYLIGKGFEVYLFCLTYDESEIGLTDYKGIHVVRYLSNDFLYKSSALAYTFPYYKTKMSAKIKEFILLYQIHVLHVHDIQIVSAAYKACKVFKIPYVLDLHENRPEIMKVYPHLKKGVGKWVIDIERWRAAEEKYAKFAKRVIVVTQEAKDELLERIHIPAKKVEVLPNTVLKKFYTEYELEESIHTKFQDDFVLLYIGDTAIRRGLLTAIKAIPVLKETIKNIKLVVVGKSTEDPILLAEVERLGIQNYVSFEGWQDEKLFPSYIISSDICISPLHRNKHHDTTYANKLFQYLSFKKPLLVSGASAQKKLVKKQGVGLCHKAKDTNDFANQVLKFYKNPTLMKEMGEAGAMFVHKEFHWAKTAKTLGKIYKKIKKTK
ncbi:glycosyl transferase [Wenyingzhuangia fucanilytica]|uniref:Glycosyl transferase n=1 Tax=Wenyingzhuangia fucanilytica TaxID=1790137 RepID=A0A1B1Y3C5_9FLAO|nr:glycosyltransferase family 4 protein [Wenyingzhuangia fucanilytica]ANW95275.1 glycosyl transferase [Wenyingzhuangia fucanilytica]